MEMERKEILELLSEGRIDVIETERLLKALAEGQAQRESESVKSSKGKQQAIQEALQSLRESLAGIGPLVGRVAGEISTEFQKDRNFPGESEAEELPELQLEGGRFHIPAGKKLYIRNDKDDGPGGGDLLIEGISGEICEVVTEDSQNLRVMRSSSGPVIRWSGGPLRVKVPQIVSELFAYTLGGDGEVSHLHCPVQLKSLGGDLKLSGLEKRFKVKTMGGNIRIQLGRDGAEDSEAKTMGGNIRIDVIEGAPGREAELVTLGGSISVEGELGELNKGINMGKQKVKVTLGEGEVSATLKVKTLGGNIEVRRARHVQ